jgi:hypothetical protein
VCDGYSHASIGKHREALRDSSRRYLFQDSHSAQLSKSVKPRELTFCYKDSMGENGFFTDNSLLYEMIPKGGAFQSRVSHRSGNLAWPPRDLKYLWLRRGPRPPEDSYSCSLTGMRIYFLSCTILRFSFNPAEIRLIGPKELPRIGPKTCLPILRKKKKALSRARIQFAKDLSINYTHLSY